MYSMLLVLSLVVARHSILFYVEIVMKEVTLDLKQNQQNKRSVRERGSYSGVKKLYIWTIGKNDHQDWNSICCCDHDCL